MKTFVAISAVIAMLSLDQASAMKSFLKNFPNGDLAFTQGLGHVSDSDTGLNDFGKLYNSKDGKWADLCKEKFPGKDFTVGAAFGDPCCKWTSGKADFTVTPFTVPTKGEVCAADKPATPAASSAAPAPAPAPAAAATPAPAGKPATPAASPAAGKDTPVVTPAPAGKATPAPAGKPDAGKPDAGKPAGGKPSKCGVKKEAKSLEDENDDDEDVFNYED